MVLMMERWMVLRIERPPSCTARPLLVVHMVGGAEDGVRLPCTLAWRCELRRVLDKPSHSSPGRFDRRLPGWVSSFDDGARC